MRKKVKLHLALIVFMMFLFNTTAAVAIESYDNLETPIMSAQTNTYSLVPNERIALDKFIELEPEISESTNITQIIFSVELDGKEWSIGYCAPKGEYSLDEMVENITSEVDYLNENRASKATMPITVSDLHCREIEIAQDRKEPLRDYQFFDTVGTLPVGELNMEVDTSLQSINGIKRYATASSSMSRTGSYHFYNSAKKLCWYNQKNKKTTTCSKTISSPHMGDGNSRYAAGYEWQPNQVKVDFVTDYNKNQNRTRLKYKYSSSNLANLSVDSNETLEMEVLFYNYHLNSGVSEENLGLAYQQTALTWTSNQPNAYLDTTLFDPSTSRAFCVGTTGVSSLEANQWYEWTIVGAKGTKPGFANDGRFRVSAQRGYRYIGNGTHSVFSEEHEPTLILGISSKYNWVSASQSAWKLAEAGKSWSYNAATDPMRT